MVVWVVLIVELEDCVVQELVAILLNATFFTVDNDGSEAAGCVVWASEDAETMVEVGTTVELRIAGDAAASAPGSTETPPGTEGPAVGGDAVQDGIEYDTD